MKILTFDIEDWFHILDLENSSSISNWNENEKRVHFGVKKILDLLDRYNQKASFFILGWISEKYPEVINSIAKRGHDIGTHSQLHTLAYTQTAYEFEKDLVNSIENIYKSTNILPKFYRAPGFSIRDDNLWAFDILKKNSIEIDASIFSASRAHGGISSYTIDKPCIIDTKYGELKAFPMNIHKFLSFNIVFSGGGYFRLLPEKILLNLFKKNNDYIMTYFHPRDFDYQQPRIDKMSFFKYFKSYVGLKNSFSKLEKIISEVSFLSLLEANKNVEWEKVKHFNFKT